MSYDFHFLLTLIIVCVIHIYAVLKHAVHMTLMYGGVDWCAHSVFPLYRGEDVLKAELSGVNENTHLMLFIDHSWRFAGRQLSLPRISTVIFAGFGSHIVYTYCMGLVQKWLMS